jgi:hypothetical protein
LRWSTTEGRKIFISKNVYFIPEYFLENNNDLAVVLVAEDFLDFSRRSNDLSVNLASSFASVVPRVAIDCCVDLPVQLAHVVSVEDSDFVSFFSILWEVLVVAVRSIDGFRNLCKSFDHSALLSASP